MSLKKSDLAIINRSFWPVYPVIGEALLRFAEEQGKRVRVCVVMQDHAGIRSKLAEYGRGSGVEFAPCKAFSKSSSGVLKRIIDTIFFMLWVLCVLVWTRPSKVYVSTDPPVLVPFIVMLYSKIFRANYIYHLQDIHPEAANVVIPINKYIYSALRKMDCIVMRHASELITINKEMAGEIRSRSMTGVPINILPNPAVSFDGVVTPVRKERGFAFCGNAGRLQRIPLIIDAIKKYICDGGTLSFVFAGGGVYAEALKLLAIKYSKVEYLGVVSAHEAAQINTNYEWAILPIEDEVTRYAFPSKSSSYVFSGALVAAVCGSHTSVSRWVEENQLGVVVEPTVGAIAGFFHGVESGKIDQSLLSADRSILKEKLEIGCFLESLTKIVIAGEAGE